MVDPVETANEQIGEAHEMHGETDPWPRRMAVVVSFLAASLALAEIGAKSSQTAYLTHHIAASDAWNFFQAKNLRANLRDSEAAILRSLPNADSPAAQERIRAVTAEEARMRDDPEGGDGMKQVKAKALELEAERDHEAHEYHGYEYTSGALEISIVLASVSVVTRIRTLGIAAAAIGLIACVYGLTIYSHLR
jgi:Domain of unknown function (DUF4337)